MNTYTDVVVIVTEYKQGTHEVVRQATGSCTAEYLHTTDRNVPVKWDQASIEAAARISITHCGNIRHNLRRK